MSWRVSFKPHSLIQPPNVSPTIWTYGDITFSITTLIPYANVAKLFFAVAKYARVYVLEIFFQDSLILSSKVKKLLE